MRISDWSSDVCSSDLKKAPKCVAMRDIRGMQAVQRDSIDLITRQNQRLRAQLNRGCRALDFYAGFYMKGNKDGRLCEGRDEIHARSGRSEEHTSELQSLMRISYAVFCLKKKIIRQISTTYKQHTKKHLLSTHSTTHYTIEHIRLQ